MHADCPRLPDPLDPPRWDAGPYRFPPGSAMPRSVGVQYFPGGLGESWEQAERPPCQDAGTTARRSPIAMRASTSTPAMPWWRPSSRWPRSTRRRGADADLGGFGALFDLKAAGFKDPILVAANDGVGTKLKIAIDTGRHATIGIDLVAMCVNDLLAQGAEPLFFLDYFASGKLDVETARSGGRGHRRGLPAGRLRADRRRDRRDAGHVRGRATTISRALPSVRSSVARILPRTDVGAGRRADRPRLLGRAFERLFAGAAAGCGREACLGCAGPVRRGTDARRGAAGADAHLREARAAGDRARRDAVKAVAHITGGGLSENLPRVLPAGLAAHVDLAAWQAPAVFGWLARAGSLDDAEMLRTFNCGIGLVLVVAAGEADGGAGGSRSRRRSCNRDRRDRARPRCQIASQGQRRGRGRALFGQLGRADMLARSLAPSSSQHRLPRKGSRARPAS